MQYKSTKQYLVGKQQHAARNLFQVWKGSAPVSLKVEKKKWSVSFGTNDHETLAIIWLGLISIVKSRTHSIFACRTLGTRFIVVGHEIGDHFETSESMSKFSRDVPTWNWFASPEGVQLTWYEPAYLEVKRRVKSDAFDVGLGSAILPRFKITQITVLVTTMRCCSCMWVQPYLNSTLSSSDGLTFDLLRERVEDSAGRPLIQLRLMAKKSNEDCLLAEQKKMQNWNWLPPGVGRFLEKL